MRIIDFGVLFLGTLLILASFASAELTNTTVNITYDAHTNSSGSTTNFGTQQKLWLGLVGSAPQQRCYFSFTNYSLPSTAVITNCTLYVRQTGTTGSPGAFSVFKYVWFNETVITWDNAPSDLATENYTYLREVTMPTSGNFHGVNVLGACELNESYIATDANYSSSVWREWRSREYSSGTESPYLYIEYHYPNNETRIRVYSEETGALLNATIYGFATAGSSSSSANATNSDYLLIPLSNLTAGEEIEIQVIASATGYAQRVFTYYGTNTELNTTINIYLSNSTNITQLQVYEPYGSGASENLVSIEKYFANGTIITIGQIELDTNGAAVTQLVPNTILYRFNVSYHNGTLRESFGDKIVLCDTSDDYCTLTLQLTQGYVPDAYFAVYGIYATCTNTSNYSNDTLTCNLTDVGGYMHGANITAYWNGTAVCSNQTNGTGTISLNCYLGNTTGKVISYVLYAILDDHLITLTGILDRTTAISRWLFGGDAALVSTFLIVTLAIGGIALSGYISIGVLMSLVGVYFLRLTSIIPVGIEVVVGLTFVGALIIYFAKEWNR